MSSPDTSKLFRKNSDGSWTSIIAIRLTGPLVQVRIEPGMTFVPGELFIGVDVAMTLDAGHDNTVNIFEEAGESLVRVV
jgi:hypothetical protein